jgi:uncharacterized protein YijF (DUF1287 family)
MVSAALAIILASTPADLILSGAKAQLKDPATYDASYRSMKYPGGDVPKNVGACSDVIVRAFRNADIDLQVLIYKDMKSTRYPGAISQRDRNIDHRRVKNQANFFKRHGKSLATKTDPASHAQWQPGDVVVWKLPSGLDHTGIISDLKNSTGLPYVIHNIRQTAEENVLDAWKIVGHYRYPKPS